MRWDNVRLLLLISGNYDKKGRGDSGANISGYLVKEQSSSIFTATVNRYTIFYMN